jgi:WD40 repeat protein
VPPHSLVAGVSEDADSAVVWGFDSDAPATRVDLSDGGQVSLIGPPSAVESLGYWALPTGAAQAWADGTVTLYGPDGAAVQTLDAHQSPVRDLAVSPVGTWAVTVGDGGLVVRWDIDPVTGHWSQRESLTGHRGDVIVAEAHPTGKQLVTASLDDTVIAWDMTGDAGFGARFPRTGDRWIANRPQLVGPDLLVAPTRPVTSARVDPTAPPDDTVSVAAGFLDARSGELVDEVVVGDTLPGDMFGASAAVSPDGGLVAVTWGQGTTVLDTGTREVVWWSSPRRTPCRTASSRRTGPSGARCGPRTGNASCSAWAAAPRGSTEKWSSSTRGPDGWRRWRRCRPSRR